eukprot:gene11039-12871_t
MNQGGINTIENILQAGPHWVAWGKTSWSISTLQEQEIVFAKTALLESINNSTIKRSTSLVTILNAGVAIASYFIAKESDPSENKYTNVRKRMNAQARNYARPLLTFLQQLKTADASSREALVSAYVGSAARYSQHLVKQLASFSDESLDELKRSLDVRKSKQSTLPSISDCYHHDVDLAEREADEEAYKEMKKKFLADLNNASTPSTVAAPPVLAEHQHVHALFDITMSASQIDHGDEQSVQGAASYGEENDDDFFDFQMENNAQEHLETFTVGRNKRKRCENTPSSSQRVRLDPTAESIAFAVSSQRLLQETLAQQQQRLETEHAQVNLQKLQLQGTQGQIQIERAKIDEDFRILRRKQQDHVAAVQAHKRQVAEDERVWQEQKQKHETDRQALAALADQVARDQREVEDLQCGFNAAMDRGHNRLNEREWKLDQWERSLQDKNHTQNQREDNLKQREDELNRRKAELDQFNSDLTHRQFELDQREDIDRASQDADAGDNDR